PVEWECMRVFLAERQERSNPAAFAAGLARRTTAEPSSTLRGCGLGPRRFSLWPRFRRRGSPGDRVATPAGGAKPPVPAWPALAGRVGVHPRSQLGLQRLQRLLVRRFTRWR